MLNSKKLITLTALLAVMSMAYMARHYTFWEAHWSGDQEVYMALAMKLDKGGLDAYNLREVNVSKSDISLFGDELKLVVGEVSPAPAGSSGNFIKMRYYMGLPYYDQPLYFMAPAFPLALMLSNRLFSNDRKYTAAGAPLFYRIFAIKPREYMDAQFYAVIVPLFFSLALILLVFFLGKALFGSRAGVYSAILMAFNPVDILSAQRIWTDGMCSFFACLSAVFFLLSLKGQKQALFAALCGMAIGISVLTRQSAMALIPVFLVLYIFESFPSPVNAVKAFRAVFNRRSAALLAAFILVTAAWFLKVHETYGTFTFIPDLKTALADDKTGWVALITARPHPLVLFCAGLPFIWPASLFAIFAVRPVCAATFAYITRRGDVRLPFLLLWVASVMGFILIMGDSLKEYRYAAQLFPPVAILASLGISRFRDLIAKKAGGGHVILPELAALIMVAAMSAWSCYHGMNAAVTHKAEIMVPF